MRRKIIAIILVGMAVCSVKSQIITPATIQTPNGSYVTDSYYISGVPDYNTNYLSALVDYVSSTYNGAEVIDVPSQKYNCHAYAWHMTEGGDTVWIGYNYPTSENIYWQDGSYIEVAESNATKVSYHETGNHSAIRINSTWYQSKWGAYALVKHHPNDVLAIYHPELPKKYYARHPSIIGPGSICGTESYSIANLPPNASVTLSLKNNPSNFGSMLQQNYPLGNQCTININNNENLNDTLIATITGTTGTIAVLKKGVKTGWNFSGTYSIYSSNVLLGTYSLANNELIGLIQGERAVLSSPFFDDAVITHTNNENFVFWRNFINSDIEVWFNSYNPPRTSIIVNGVNSSPCDNFTFHVGQVYPFNFSPLLQIEGRQINVYLNKQDVDYARENALTWIVEVSNMITGENVYTGEIENYNGTIDATRWKSGVYAIRNRIGDNIVVQKIAIKNN